MKLQAPAKKQQLLDPILPLINVVFLLLIFVMMMSSIESSNDPDIHPPISNSDAPTGLRDSMIRMNKDGQITLEGRLLDSNSLIAYAQQLKQTQPDAWIKLKADAEIESLLLIEVMEKLRIGGVENLLLLTEKEH